MIRSRTAAIALTCMAALLAGCVAVPRDASTHPAGAGLAATGIPLAPWDCA